MKNLFIFFEFILINRYYLSYHYFAIWDFDLDFAKHFDSLCKVGGAGR